MISDHKVKRETSNRGIVGQPLLLLLIASCYYSTLSRVVFVDKEKRKRKRKKREQEERRKGEGISSFRVGRCVSSRPPPDSPTDRDFGIIDSILEADLIINRADLELERERKKKRS